MLLLKVCSVGLGEFSHFAKFVNVNSFNMGYVMLSSAI